MSSLLDYSILIVRNLNLGVGQSVEIVCPLECKELAETLKDVLVRSFVNVSVTYNNECDEYYAALGADYYDKLIECQFVRISIISSFTNIKSKKYIESQTMKVRNYLYSSHSQRTVVAYQNEIWAKRLGITYLELKNRIIDMALRGNPLSKYIDDLYNCDIKYARIKSSIGTNLYMEFTDGFIFNDGFIKTENGVYSKELTSQHVFDILFNSGWFELKTAIELRKNSHIGNIWLNCEFKDTEGEPKNEIDIIAELDNRLVFVECKTMIHDTTDIDKFRSALRNFSGTSSTGVFVTNDNPSVRTQLRYDHAMEKCKDNNILTFNFSLWENNISEYPTLEKIVNDQILIQNKR